MHFRVALARAATLHRPHPFAKEIEIQKKLHSKKVEFQYNRILILTKLALQPSLNHTPLQQKWQCG